MGTRIHVYLSHDLAQFDDTTATLSRLRTALPPAQRVGEYWRSVHPSSTTELTDWVAEPANPRLPHVREYDGPGSLYVKVTSSAALVFTSARWRGFLSIEPLRRVHLAAFQAIAIALGSRKLALCHDSQDAVYDLFLDGGTQDDCIERLRACLGPPQTAIEVVAPDIVAQTEHGVPSVWFLMDAAANPTEATASAPAW